MLEREIARRCSLDEYRALGREVGRSLAPGVLTAVLTDPDLIDLAGLKVCFMAGGLPRRGPVLDFVVRKNLARPAIVTIATLEAELVASGVDRSRILAWRDGAVHGLRDALTGRRANAVVN